MDIIGTAIDAAGIFGPVVQKIMAAEPAKDRTERNRFHESEKKADFSGREDELACLVRFCLDKSKNVSWFAISGKGGSGKTRLARELMLRMKKEGWKAHKVDHDRRAELEDAEEDVRKHRKVLLVFDYIKWHMESVGNAADRLFDYWDRRDTKVRILLIERDKIEPDKLLGHTQWKRDFLDRQYQPEEEAAYLDNNGLMRLLPLKKGALTNIVTSYAKNMGYEADQVDAASALETLRQIDPELQRPLFAQYIADAQATQGVDSVRQWDPYAAHKYVYDKELERILYNCSNLTSLSSYQQRRLKEITLELLLSATLAGGIDWSEIAREDGLFASEYQKLCEYKGLLERADPRYVLKEALGEAVGERLNPLEPDLVGEYFAVRQLHGLLCDEKVGDKDIGTTRAVIEKASKTSLRGCLAKCGMIFSDFPKFQPVQELRSVLSPSALVTALNGPPFISFGGYDWDKLDERTVDGKRQVLLITREVIERRAYNDKFSGATWKTCTLRKYLNGEFLKRFSEEDQARIELTRNENPDNTWGSYSGKRYKTPGGDPSDDQVFLLSVEEVLKYFPGLKLHKGISGGEWYYEQYDRLIACDKKGRFWWWLRSPGRIQNGAACVGVGGDVYLSGHTVNSELGVRPALWLNL